MIIFFFYFNLTGNSFELRGILIGSNQAVNSLDFDSTGTLILGTSNDFASRVWGINDHRLRVSVNHDEKKDRLKFSYFSKRIFLYFNFSFLFFFSCLTSLFVCNLQENMRKNLTKICYVIMSVRKKKFHFFHQIFAF